MGSLLKLKGSSGATFEVTDTAAGVVSVLLDGTKVLGEQQAAIASVAGSAPAGGTGAAAGGWDTAANRDLAIAAINETKAQVNLILTALRTAGIIAT